MILAVLKPARQGRHLSPAAVLPGRSARGLGPQPAPILQGPGRLEARDRGVEARGTPSLKDRHCQSLGLPPRERRAQRWRGES